MSGWVFSIIIHFDLFLIMTIFAVEALWAGSHLLCQGWPQLDDRAETEAELLDEVGLRQTQEGATVDAVLAKRLKRGFQISLKFNNMMAKS